MELTDNIVLTITDEDIKRSVRGSVVCCPIAMAFKRVFKRRVWVMPTGPDYYVDVFEGMSKTYKLCPADSYAVSEYDSGKPFSLGFVNLERV